MKTKTEIKPQHTPTPWSAEVVNTQVGHCWVIYPIGACLYVDNQRLPHEADNQPSVEARANAAYIVRAVNSHEVLLAFAKLVSHNCTLAPEWKREADKAIAKAEAQS